MKRENGNKGTAWLLALILLLTTFAVGFGIHVVKVKNETKRQEEESASISEWLSVSDREWKSYLKESERASSEHRSIAESEAASKAEAESYSRWVSASEKASEKASVQASGQETASLSVPPSGKKVVYLTFDDGPSKNTPRILEILKQENIKATFFVKNAGKYNVHMKAITDAGHTIALHTYSHDYKTIYASEKAYFTDLQNISDLVYLQTGVRSKLIRFPGGSSNTVSRKYCKGIMTALSKSVGDKGYRYFDWNVSSGDAESERVPVASILANCKKIPSSRNLVVLMHDIGAKDTTVEALPAVIAYYKSMGYSFAAITEDTPPLHHGKINN